MVIDISMVRMGRISCQVSSGSSLAQGLFLRTKVNPCPHPSQVGLSLEMKLAGRIKRILWRVCI